MATHIRGSVLHSSVLLLKSQGLFDRYLAALDPTHRPTLESLVTSDWLPMEVAVAHYGAIDGLGLPDEQAYRNGRASADRVQGSYTGVVVRMLGMGIPMWAALRRFPAFGERLTRGGAHAVYRTGDRAARLEFHGMPYAHFRYVRHGWRGMIDSTTAFLTRTAETRDVSRPGDHTTARYLLTW